MNRFGLEFASQLFYFMEQMRFDHFSRRQHETPPGYHQGEKKIRSISEFTGGLESQALIPLSGSQMVKQLRPGPCIFIR